MFARAVAVVVTTAALTAAALATTSAAQAAGAGSGNCGASGYPWGYDISCQSGSATTGTPGRARSATANAEVSTACALYPVAGNSSQMLQVCPHGLRLAGGRNGVNLLNATNTLIRAGVAGPAVTPQELLAWAQNELALPLPEVRTARPRGTEALVGLPEWFWITPAQWHPVTATVSVGGVWAQVTARPVSLEIRPGDGGGITCRGPGAIYDTRLSAGAQHSDCAWTYDQPSAGLPGNRYQVSVTVTWTAAWHGSGGAGGVLLAVGRTTTFGLAVVEGQALILGS
jgi:hypothetical protein